MCRCCRGRGLPEIKHGNQKTKGQKTDRFARRHGFLTAEFYELSDLKNFMNFMNFLTELMVYLRAF